MCKAPVAEKDGTGNRWGLIFNVEIVDGPLDMESEKNLNMNKYLHVADNKRMVLDICTV